MKYTWRSIVGIGLIFSIIYGINNMGIAVTDNRVLAFAILSFFMLLSDAILNFRDKE